MLGYSSLSLSLLLFLAVLALNVFKTGTEFRTWVIECQLPTGINHLKSQSWTPRASAISFLTFEAKSIGSAFSSSVGLCGGRNSSSTFSTEVTSVSHFLSVNPYFVGISITAQYNYLCRPVTCCINEAGEETMGLIPSPWNCISLWGHMVPEEEIQLKKTSLFISTDHQHTSPHQNWLNRLPR